MLVLSRKPGERIRIGDDIEIIIMRIGPNAVRVGVEAPRSVNIARSELIDTTSGEAGPIQKGETDDDENR